MLRILALASLLMVSPAYSAAPVIAVNGVRNAASYADPRLPNGAIAEGSLFNIFGANMGPSVLTHAASLPLPTSLSGTGVTVTINGATNACFLIYTSDRQVAAILPSATPAGSGTITVTYNGVASDASAITVVKSSFGIFTANQQGFATGVIQDGNYRFNSFQFAFQPGETVVLWGTGLGPIAGSDAVTPPTGNLPGISVAVAVGGTPATVTYAGRSGYAGDDQVAFTIPPGVSGCNVPLAVTVSGVDGSNPVVSDLVMVAIGASTSCSSQTLPPGVLQILAKGGTVRTGSILLQRAATTSNIAGAITNTTVDSGTASFDNSGLLGFSSDLNYGACIVYNNTATFSISFVPPYNLDPGPAINVSGPEGVRQLARLGATAGSFYMFLGGNISIPGESDKPLYLSPGVYAIDNGGGGADVGAFKLNIAVPASLTWTNRDQIASVPRSRPLTVTWSGGDPSSDVFITGSSGVASDATVSFYCRAMNSAGALTVPSAILQALPASASAAGVTMGRLQVYTNNSAPVSVNPAGLDLFMVGAMQSVIVTNLAFQ